MVLNLIKDVRVRSNQKILILRMIKRDKENMLSNPFKLTEYHKEKGQLYF